MPACSRAPCCLLSSADPASPVLLSFTDRSLLSIPLCQPLGVPALWTSCPCSHTLAGPGRRQLTVSHPWLLHWARLGRASAVYRFVPLGPQRSLRCCGVCFICLLRQAPRRLQSEYSGNRADGLKAGCREGWGRGGEITSSQPSQQLATKTTFILKT